MGPLVGGTVANTFAGRPITLTIGLEGPAWAQVIPTMSLEGIDFAFLLAFGVGLIAIQLLARVIETGETDRSALAFRFADEVRRPLVNFSTVGGFSQVVTFPVSAARQLTNAQKRGRTGRKEDQTEKGSS